MGERANRQQGPGTDSADDRGMLRSMSAIGGAQIVQVVLQLVRAKCVALLLGPSGMGVSSLLSSSASVIQQAGSMGTPAAVVRHMALAHGNAAEVSSLAVVARRMAACLALVSAAACFILAMPLSAVTLGGYAGAWQYLLVGGAVGFGIMADTERAMLQGRRRISYLAWSTCLSASIGLAVCVPMYWGWGVSGIAPAMLALAVCMWGFYRFGNRGIAQGAGVSWSRLYVMSRPLLAFGVAMMGAQMIGAMAQYAQNVFIRMAGGAADVGIWQSSASICAQGASMLFAVMAMDYYPRLSRAIMRGGGAMVLRRQTRLVAIVTAPLSMLIALCAPLIVRVLLSDEFEGAVPLLRILSVSLFFQAVSYPAGYVTLAAGNKRLYFWMEGVGFNALQMILVVAGYLLLGLVGVGAAYACLHAVSLIVYAIVNKRLCSLCYAPGDIALVAALSLAVTSVSAILMC